MTIEEYRAAIERLTDLELAVARLIGSKKPEPQFSGSPEHQTICRYISDTPALFSLLYDLNLLPEQVKSNSRDETIMAHITMAWRANAEAASPTLPAKIEPAWDELEEGHKYLDKLGIPRLGEAGTLTIQGRIDWLDFGRGRVRPAAIWHDARTDPPKLDGMYIAYFAGSSFTSIVGYRSRWLYADTGTKIPPGDVTHWMELPPPPKI